MPHGCGLWSYCYATAACVSGMECRCRGIASRMASYFCIQRRQGLPSIAHCRRLSRGLWSPSRLPAHGITFGQGTESPRARSQTGSGPCADCLSWRVYPMVTRIASGIPKRLNTCWPVRHSTGFQFFWDTSVSPSPRSTTRHGCVPDKNKSSRMYGGLGTRTRCCSLRRRVHLGYTVKGSRSTD